MFEGVGSVEDGVIKGDVDQFVDSLGVHICPYEVGPFFQEVGKWSGDVGKAWDKWSLVSEYSQCQSYLFQGSEFSWPVFQAFDFDRVDVDLFPTDDNP